MFKRTKRTLAISLFVFFVASLTAASVSAQVNSAFSTDMDQNNDDNGNCVSYKVTATALKTDCPSGDCTYVWNFDSHGITSKQRVVWHTFQDCDEHTVSLDVEDNTDGTISGKTEVTVSP